MEHIEQAYNDMVTTVQDLLSMTKQVAQLNDQIATTRHAAGIKTTAYFDTIMTEVKTAEAAGTKSMSIPLSCIGDLMPAVVDYLNKNGHSCRVQGDALQVDVL